VMHLTSLRILFRDRAADPVADDLAVTPLAA
jgi:hypothetical protein